MKKYIFLFLTSLIALLFISTGCKKYKGLSKGNLSFSVDTLVFDTIFTTIGSTTKQFKIYNNDSKELTIDQVELIGGENSPFMLNLDGVPAKYFSNVRLEGNDSLFMFIEVKLKVNNQIHPMVIEDSIRFRTNGKDQYIRLAAWGQDVYYHYYDTVHKNTSRTWLNDKPHLIYGASFIDEGTLDIQAGAKVYMHKNAILFNSKGTLNVNGELGKEVVFQGDRLEIEYRNIPGQYYGIYFDSARPSLINYAIIKNGTNGIHLFSTNSENSPTDYTLTIKNSKIANNSSNGMLIYYGARVKAENCIIAKNGSFGLLVLLSGGFNFNHCDILGFHEDAKDEALAIVNHFVIDGVTNVGSINEGIIRNSIIYGFLDSEIIFDTIGNTPGVNLNFDIQRCLIKKDSIGKDSFYSNDNIWNINPMFYTVSDYGFPISINSPLKGLGDPNFPTSTGTNIEGLVISPPNIGAY